MPFNNINAIHFTQPEIDQIIDLVTQIKDIILPKLANLSPEERQRYGSINEQNKLFVNKVRDYYTNQPSLSTPDVDWTEFGADFKDREFLGMLGDMLNGLLDGIFSAKIMHDYDNYHAALTDYNYTKYKAGTAAVGYETKAEELKQFFKGGRPPADNGETPPAE